MPRNQVAATSAAASELPAGFTRETNDAAEYIRRISLVAPLLTSDDWNELRLEHIHLLCKLDRIEERRRKGVARTVPVISLTAKRITQGKPAWLAPWQREGGNL